MHITYNAPVVLTFSLLAATLMLLGTFTSNVITEKFFAVYPTIDWKNPVDWFQLVSHVLGHSDWGHLFGNLTFLLLLGPALEEKYGSVNLLEMILLTAVVTGLVTVFLFSSGLLGASGIVFMFILLSSYANAQEGEIPLTFVLIAFLFIGKELLSAFSHDDISQMAHIVGGLCGGIFGFARSKSKDSSGLSEGTEEIC